MIYHFVVQCINGNLYLLLVLCAKLHDINLCISVANDEPVLVIELEAVYVLLILQVEMMVAVAVQVVMEVDLMIDVAIMVLDVLVS